MSVTIPIHRRSFLLGAGATGAALGTGLGAAYTQNGNAADYTLRIAPLRLELAPEKVIDTFGYNGMVPGPLLRLRMAGHRFTVVALDGNPVATQKTVDTVFLAPAERADVIVTMDNPGVWIFGGVKDEDRSMGLGIIIEYANRAGEPQWLAPTDTQWDYTIFGDDRTVAQPDHRIELAFEKIPGGRGGFNRWTLNDKSWPNTNPLFTTEQGKRYRLVMTNKSGDNHPVHLHRHTFEITKVGEKSSAGVMKDTVNMTRFSTVEIDFVADNPGPTLLHCHHQDHQDQGFMGLVTYL